MADARPFYTRFAWAFDLLIPTAAGPSPHAVVALFVDHGVTTGATVVDAGCGTGTYTIALAAAGFDAIGIDRSPDLLREARAKAGRHEVQPSFVDADLLSWHPPGLVDGVLCRGVLNDMVTDEDRGHAFDAFAAWLRPRGVLVADARDWPSTSRRYADQAAFERSFEHDRGALTFRSTTSVDAEMKVLHIDERFVGTIDGQAIDDRSEFTMRCWTVDELRERAARSGFTRLDLVPDRGDGRQPDRLVIVAER